ncbi:MAG: hypothetical protein ACI8S6_001158 [Myxococcota bacterium]|jgi:hypothetical protein
MEQLDTRASEEGWSTAEMHETIRRARGAFIWLPLLCGVALAALVVGFHEASPAGIFAQPVIAWWAGAIFGVVGLVVTVLLTGQVARAGLRWSPFHGDGLGGVRILSNYSLRTAMMFGVGALAVPFVCVMLYTACLMLSFLLPTFALGSFATREKEQALGDIGRQLSAAQAALEAGEVDDVLSNRCMACIELRREINATVAYPFSPGQILRLGLSAMAPLVLFSAEHFLSKVL